jgi:hypothetical protein
MKNTSKGKTIPVQTWTGPEGSRSLRLSDFKTIGTQSRKHRAPLPPRKYSWYSFLSEAELTPGSECSRKDDGKENSKDTIGNRTHDLPACSTVPQPTVPPNGLNMSSTIHIIKTHKFYNSRQLSGSIQNVHKFYLTMYIAPSNYIYYLD